MHARFCQRKVQTKVLIHSVLNPDYGKVVLTGNNFLYSLLQPYLYQNILFWFCIKGNGSSNEAQPITGASGKSK